MRLSLFVIPKPMYCYFSRMKKSTEDAYRVGLKRACTSCYVQSFCTKCAIVNIVIIVFFFIFFRFPYHSIHDCYVYSHIRKKVEKERQDKIKLMLSCTNIYEFFFFCTQFRTKYTTTTTTKKTQQEHRMIHITSSSYRTIFLRVRPFFSLSYVHVFSVLPFRTETEKQKIQTSKRTFTIFIINRYSSIV